MAHYSIMKAPPQEAQDRFAKNYEGKDLAQTVAKLVGEAAMNLAADLIERSNRLPQPIQNLALMAAIETLHQMWEQSLATTTPAFQETTRRILGQAIEAARAEYDAAVVAVEAEEALGVYVPKGDGMIN